jgi:hypothetical protein
VLRNAACAPISSNPVSGQLPVCRQSGLTTILSSKNRTSLSTVNYVCDLSRDGQLGMCLSLRPEEVARTHCYKSPPDLTEDALRSNSSRWGVGLCDYQFSWHF